MIEIAEIESPVGVLTLAVRGDRVCALSFGRRGELAPQLAQWYPGEPLVRSETGGAAGSAVRAYFDGQLNALDDVPVSLNGTPFQVRVWEALRRIPAGRTRSYTDIAREIGTPSAVRAVGAANGANPVAVIVPCHRVIGSNGKLTGYGGGLDRKEWLLRHEGVGAALLF